MIKQQIICDCSGEELVGQGLVNATIVNIQHKVVDTLETQKADGSGVEQKDFVKQIQNYQFHLSKEHAPEFMQLVQDFFKKYNS